MNMPLKEFLQESSISSKPANEAEMKRVTEVIIPQGQNSNAIIFPLVASLSQQNSEEKNISEKKSERWVTWITDRKPNTQQINHLGASVDTLRIVHTNAKNDCRWILWEALRAGNSHTVIADIDRLSDSDIKEMEVAARTGNCTGIITHSSRAH
jgi:cell division inhibitor SulA